MGWSIGHDSKWDRDIGYGVPATCDHPECDEEIDRGLGYVCGGEPRGGENGCGLYFCSKHLGVMELCDQCFNNDQPFEKTPDVFIWVNHKMTDESWETWRRIDMTEEEYWNWMLMKAKM